MSEPPFGALRPGPFARATRAFARALPYNFAGRKLASALLLFAGGRRRRAYDVDIFDSEKARLHPYDNISEKRVYLTPQHWDPAERALLGARIAGGREPFTFVDVGANAGLYSLFAASAARAAQRPIRIVAIEADPVMCARMEMNFKASGVDAEIVHCAAAAAHGEVHIEFNAESRGMSRIVRAGGAAVEAAPLHAIFAERGVAAIDAMKIDIEGHERPALETFFREAPAALWPRLMILEISHDDPAQSASALVAANGYVETLNSGLNAVFERGSSS